MRRQTYTIHTCKMSHFDIETIDDAIRSRDRHNDHTPTRRVYDNVTGKCVDVAEAICWNKEEHERVISQDPEMWKMYTESYERKDYSVIGR